MDVLVHVFDFLREGFRAFHYTLTWAALFWIGWSFLQRAGNSIVKRFFERLEHRVIEAVREARFRDALRLCDRMSFCIDTFRWLLSSPRKWEVEYFRLLGDVYFEMGEYQRAFYAYLLFLLRDMSFGFIGESWVLSAIMPLPEAEVPVYMPPLYADVMHRMGLAALRCGRPEEAILWLRRSMTATPFPPDEEMLDALREAYSKLRAEPQVQ